MVSRKLAWNVIAASKVLLPEGPVICYKQPDGITFRSSETRDE